MSKIAIRINAADVVAVALQPLSKGTQVVLEALDRKILQQDTNSLSD